LSLRFLFIQEFTFKKSKYWSFQTPILVQIAVLPLWEAAITSFMLFTIGAVIPVIPYIFFAGTAGIFASAAASSFGLFIIGATITLMTGRNAVYSGLRQVLFGLAAAVVTFGVGRLIGVNLGA
jgi:VIT1/CCC1 family predicted Fe2+/Mn2+ transporter